MLQRYSAWVIRTAYRVDKATYIWDEPGLVIQKGSPGGVLAVMLVAWPFVLAGIGAWLLPASDATKLAIIALDAFVMSTASIVLAIKITRAQKAGAAASLASQEQRAPGQNAGSDGPSELTEHRDDSNLLPK